MLLLGGDKAAGTLIWLPFSTQCWSLRNKEVWGVPIRAKDLKCAHCRSPRLCWVVGDIFRMLCSAINCNMCNLYWNKNISTFLINGTFVTKLNLALFVGTPCIKMYCDRAILRQIFSPYSSSSALHFILVCPVALPKWCEILHLLIITASRTISPGTNMLAVESFVTT